MLCSTVYFYKLYDFWRKKIMKFTKEKRPESKYIMVAMNVYSPICQGQLIKKINR